MALTGNQHHVFHVSLADALGNGQAAVELLHSALRLAHALQHLLQYVLRVFAARVVAGQAHHIGIVFGATRHGCAFAAVAVAAATEHTVQAPAARVRPRAQCLQSLGHRIRRVRIVDHHRRCAVMAELLHATGHGLQIVASGYCICQGMTGLAQSSDHAQQIHHIKVAQRSGGQADALGGFAHLKSHALGGGAYMASVNIGCTFHGHSP